MKLRSVRTVILLVVVALILGVGVRYINSDKNHAVNEIKSKLTIDTTTQKTPPKGLRALIAKNIEKQQEMTERTDFGPPLIEQERFYTELEIASMTEGQFEDLLKTVELKLPKLSDIKKLPPGALHRTPELVLQAGKDLGLIKEVLAVHESYERNAVGFYDECAKSVERPTPVRALCLTNLIVIKKKNGEKINSKAYPAELLELTKMITDL
jgi:hypothetical protein